jgi:chemotaxis protein histidine kinase CheA
MRSTVNSIQLLNWRLVWIGTFLFMGLYFVAFDNQPPLTPDQIQEIQKDLPLETGTSNMASKATSIPKKNVYDSRFDDQIHIEDPNPVLGTKWDSPLDAIPGRLSPVESQELRGGVKAQKILNEATSKMEKATMDKEEAEKAKADKAEKEKPKEEKPKEEKPKEEKAKEEKPQGGKPKESKSPDAKPKATPKEEKAKIEKPKIPKPSEDASNNEKLKEGPEKGKPKDDKSKTETPKPEPKGDKPKDDKSKEKPKEGKPEVDKSKEQKLKDDKLKNEKPKEDAKKKTEEKTPTKIPEDETQAKKLAEPPKADERLVGHDGVAEGVDPKKADGGVLGHKGVDKAADPKKADGVLGHKEMAESVDLSKGVPPDDYVALCVAVKDQTADLPEFFIHHFHHIGIRRFYIMDDRSKTPLSSVKDYGIPNEYITFESQEPYTRQGGHHEQMAIYERCMNSHRLEHTWLAFIDADEFIEMTAGNETLQDLLHEFEKHEDIGALAMNWRMHTSSGLEKRPESARKAFVDCIWDDDENGGAASNNTHVKSIVRTSRGTRPVGPHMWFLNGDTKTVGEHMDPVTTQAWRLPITRTRIALHHYAGKSREEYEEKMLRGNAMDDPKGESFWNSLEHGLQLVPCLEMAKYDP